MFQRNSKKEDDNQGNGKDPSLKAGDGIFWQEASSRKRIDVCINSPRKKLCNANLVSHLEYVSRDELVATISKVLEPKCFRGLVAF